MDSAATTSGQQSNKAAQQNQQLISSQTSSSTSAANSKRQTASSSRNHAPMIGASSAAFQQIKQTQSSLARLTRVHQLLQQQQQQQQLSQTNQSSQHQQSREASHPARASSTFVDCLIRRFKDCFSEDFCTVPMFVVGNLSPGSDGKYTNRCRMEDGGVFFVCKTKQQQSLCGNSSILLTFSTPRRDNLTSQRYLI